MSQTVELDNWLSIKITFVYLGSICQKEKWNGKTKNRYYLAYTWYLYALLEAGFYKNLRKGFFSTPHFPIFPVVSSSKKKNIEVSTLNEFYTWVMNIVGSRADFFSSFTCNNDRGLHFHRKVGTHLLKLTNLARILLTYISTHNSSIYLPLNNDYGECCIFFFPSLRKFPCHRNLNIFSVIMKTMFRNSQMMLIQKQLNLYYENIWKE